MHLLAKVKLGVKRFNLLQQIFNELFGVAYRDPRYVINRFVGIELSALSSRHLHAVDNMGFDSKQAQLEYLEQATWPRANYQCICLDGH